MAKASSFVTVYRSIKTGRFSKKSLWKRDKGHKRYKRQRYLKGRVKTFFVTLKYTNARGTRTFDFLVRAKKCSDAFKFIQKYAKTHSKLAFAEDDPRTRDYGDVLAYLESFGWAEKRCAETVEFSEYDTQA